MKLHGSGFLVTPAQARSLGLGTIPKLELHIRPYRNGRDLTATPRGMMAIDLFGMTENEVRHHFLDIFHYLFDRVRPERFAKSDTPDGKSYAKFWWLFGKTRPDLRSALAGLSRYIVTAETAKHRVFQFLDAEVLPDNMLVCIALSDGYSLGVLSSRIHVAWALAAGGRLGIGNDPRYNKTRCFDPFPFPDASEQLRATITALAEELDNHRKQILATHPKKFTLTELYNVLDARRQKRPLSPAEEDVNRLGNVAVMEYLHDQLDREVATAYGWPADLTDEQYVAHIVTLNRARHREESKGLIRWLRPEYQNPAERAASKQISVELDEGAEASVQLAWPKVAVDRLQLLLQVLNSTPEPIEVKALARQFKGARVKDVSDYLNALASTGEVRHIDADRYAL
jgi:hypothetical protein